MHYNFVWGPLLITPEHLTPIPVESLKFHEVSERNQLKSTKGGVFSKIGRTNSNFQIWALPQHFGSLVAS